MSLRIFVALVTLVMLASQAGCAPRRGGGERRTAASQVPEGASDATETPKKKSAEKPAAKTPSTKPSQPETTPSSESTDLADAACYKGDAAICAAELKIFELTNKVRAGRGLQPLVFSPKVSFVARGWSSEQSKSGDISHDGFPQARQSTYQAEFGRAFDSDAENVAMTGGSNNPAEDFVDMWVGSFGHLRNMLGNYQVLGVGIAQSADGSWYATQIFGAE